MHWTCTEPPVVDFVAVDEGVVVLVVVGATVVGVPGPSVGSVGPTSCPVASVAGGADTGVPGLAAAPSPTPGVATVVWSDGDAWARFVPVPGLVGAAIEVAVPSAAVTFWCDSVTDDESATPLPAMLMAAIDTATAIAVPAPHAPTTASRECVQRPGEDRAIGPLWWPLGGPTPTSG
jgi:hypothetical protein